MDFEGASLRLEVSHLVKYFGAVHANDGISIAFEPGIIHGILGENGAGKSTLMKLLSGVLIPDSGSILLDNQAVRFRSPAHALDTGIGMLHQDPQDFPNLSVCDNFLIGSHESWILNRRKTRKVFREISEKYGFSLDPDQLVETLTIGERQQLEIIRLLHRKANTLIFDEPTTAISAQQKSKLFESLKRLAVEGITVVYVTHKLEEAIALCSRITVMKKGRISGIVENAATPDELIRMMFDIRADTICTATRVPKSTKNLLSTDRLLLRDRRLNVMTLDFSVKSGEIVGLAGMEGSGQSLLIRTCAGLHRSSAGSLTFMGIDMTNRPYRKFIEAGISYLPAGRLEEGLIRSMNLKEHVALVDPEPGIFRKETQIHTDTLNLLHQFNVKALPEDPVEALSGGNQQRFLLALMPSDSKLYLLEHPTRGLDIVSSAKIWEYLHARVETGASVLFFSSDLDELLANSDRIAIFFNGRIVATVPALTTSHMELGEWIGGKGMI